MARHYNAQYRPGTFFPSRGAVGLSHHFQRIYRLLTAPNVKNRKRPRKQRYGADRQAGINLWTSSDFKGHAMSYGACAEHNSKHYRVLQKIFCHDQFLSGDNQKICITEGPQVKNQTPSGMLLSTVIQA
jgi:hypothetical protein